MPTYRRPCAHLQEAVCPLYRRLCTHLQEAVRPLTGGCAPTYRRPRAHLQEAVQVCDGGGRAMSRALCPHRAKSWWWYVYTCTCVHVLMCLHL